MKIVKAGVMAAVALCAVLFLQGLLIPKYMSGVYEGALTSEYYKSEKNHQVIFVGDCEVYENFSPVALWREYGITSYIRGGAQQLIWQSYYLLEDTLRYETPDVVVFNVLSMKYGDPQSEAYNRLNLDDMRPSLSKFNAVKSSMTDGENPLSYFFPILRYHERWKELNSDDFKYFFSRQSVSHNGFIMRCDVKPVSRIPMGLKLADYAFSPLCYEYLDKMKELCKKNNIKLVLVKAPSISPYWYPEWEEQITEYADKNGLLYLNFLELSEDAGIDYQTDTYNAGLHLNVYGAEKLARYFGGILKETYSLPDMRSNAAIAADWEKKCSVYDKMKQAQESELNEYGIIKTFTYKN